MDCLVKHPKAAKVSHPGLPDHPATTTHSRLTDAGLGDVGISRSTIRLSIGTEHIDDIIDDLDQAFAAVSLRRKNLNSRKDLLLCLQFILPLIN